MFEGFKVLFIEDDPPVRASLVQTLELSGLAVQAFGSAELALPHITPEIAERMAQLAASGPPVEQVGLEPFPTAPTLIEIGARR